MLISLIVLEKDIQEVRQLETFCALCGFARLLRIFRNMDDLVVNLKINKELVGWIDTSMINENRENLESISRMGIPVIFTSNDTSYSLEAWNAGAIDFLIKPFEYKRFLTAMERAAAFLSGVGGADHKETQGCIMVRADYSQTLIPLNQVQYVQALDDYVKIFLDDRKTVITKLTMKEMLARLPSDRFIRVHRSFIIPVHRILYIRNKMIALPGAKIPLGACYENDLLMFLGIKNHVQ